MMEKIIKFYCDNEQRELKKIVYPIMLRLDGISQMDYDDFYSLAALTLWQATKTYDTSKEVCFEIYLKVCLTNRFYSMIEKRNAMKRTCDRITDSLDAPIGDEGMTLCDFLISDFNLEEYVLMQSECFGEEKVEIFLSGLSKVQRSIIELKMKEVSVLKIKERLKLTNEQYINYMKSIRKAYVDEFMEYMQTI